jgi:ketosteroid isomerase-like protein
LRHRRDIDVAKPFDPVAALKAYHAAIEARDLKVIGSLLAQDAIYQSKGLGLVKGRDAILAVMENYFKDHPDHRAWDTSVKAKSSYISYCEWQLRTTNIETKTPVSRHGTEHIFFDVEGLIVAVEVEDVT